jgi:hypothetical protein
MIKSPKQAAAQELDFATNFAPLPTGIPKRRCSEKNETLGIFDIFR